MTTLSCGREIGQVSGHVGGRPDDTSVISLEPPSCVPLALVDARSQCRVKEVVR